MNGSRDTALAALRACSGAVVTCALLGGCTTPFEVEGPETCEIADQNDFVFRQMAHSYYWNETLPDTIDPADYDDPADVARALRYDELDRWSYVADKGMADAYFQEGKFIGHGFNRRWESSTSSWRIARVHGNSPSLAAGLERGDTILTVNGIPTETLDDEGTWNAELGPDEPDVEIAMTYFDLSDGVERETTLVKDWISIVAVSTTEIIERDGHTIGYLAFETFVNTADAELDTAYAEFRDAGVTDLVIDLRYNGGGTISTAGHIIDLTLGQDFKGDLAYEYRLNDNLKRHEFKAKIERLSQSIAPQAAAFITSGTTISAAELVINSIRAHIPVYTVGTTTGGKPVGSRGFDFCEHKLFSIMFELVNADGEGGYYDGIEPDGPAGDDFDHLRGDPDEAMLAVALDCLTQGGCPASALIVDPNDEEERFGARQRPEPSLRAVIGFD
jgi:C-terminal processing protease CtpA/Prc